MTAVIIDNSTLSAVQRLIGTAPAPNSYDAQGDYSALENLFLHLLFFDDYYFVNDYKEEFRANRAKEFSFIHPIPLDFFPYGELEKIAVAQTKQLMLDIRGGTQADGLLKEFLEAMNLHVTCAWHMQSSDFFLTLKILADERDNWETRYKYSPLTAMIFQELSRDTSSHEPPNLVSSDGANIPLEQKKGHRSYVVSGELLDFSNSLNWLARRTAFYTMLSSHFGVSIALHPIRHNFLSRWSTTDSIIKGSPIWRAQLGHFFGTKSIEAINAINASTESLEIGANLPLFAAWAVGSCGSVKDSLPFILDIAQKPETIALRKHFGEIDRLRNDGEVLKHKKAINELRAAIEIGANNMMNRYAKAKAISAPSVSINAQLLPIPKLSFDAKADVANFKLKFGPARHVRTLLRNVVTDVVSFNDLGAVKASLLRNVNRSEKSTVPALRIEQKRFFGRSSDWKEPM